MRFALCAIMISAVSPAQAGAFARAVVVPGPSVLPLPVLALPLTPRLSLVSPALLTPSLPSLAAAPIPNLARPTFSSALPAAAVAIPAAPPAAVIAAPAALAVPEGRRMSSSAKAVAAVSRGAIKHGGVSANVARAAAFFDGARAFPDLVEAAGVDGFVRELREPARLLQAMGVKGTVTVYGSARIPSREAAQAALEAAFAEHGRRPKTAAGRKALTEARAALRSSHWYEEARRFGRLVAERGGGQLAVVTGGGPGIMEGANRGAFEAGGKSVGYNIALPKEQGVNPWTTPGLNFEFQNFTTRKMNLRHGAVGLAYFPGGVGTMDELFEVLTLIQTGKMPRVPIVLVGKKAYWKKVLDFSEFARQGLISEKDLDLFRFAEDADRAWSAIEAAAAR